MEPTPPPADPAPVVVTRDGPVALVTLNRPAQRNALNRALQLRLPELIAELDADEDVRAIVLTGADPAFCAGVDLKELGAGDVELVLPKNRRGPLPPHRTPLIGAVNGPAVTGGLELALACDLLVASDRASFADTHARVGVMPGWGLTVLLPRAVGEARAREMSFTGNYVDAATALVWGLVNHVVPHDRLVETSVALAHDIATNNQHAVQQIGETYRQTTSVPLDEAWAIEDRICRAWSTSDLDLSRVEAIRDQVRARGRAQKR